MRGEGEELNTKHGAYGPLMVIHMKLELEAVNELFLSCMLSSLVRIVLRGPLLGYLRTYSGRIQTPTWGNHGDSLVTFILGLPKMGSCLVQLTFKYFNLILGPCCAHGARKPGSPGGRAP